MSKTYVPVSINTDQDRGVKLRDLKSMGATRVYIAYERLPFSPCSEREAELENLRENIEFYESNGFEVGVWIAALGFGGPQRDINREAAKDFVRIKGMIGEKTLDDAICPLDQNYLAAMGGIVEDICRAGAKMIMFDDEFCLSIRPNIGCVCDLHMAEFRRRLGEDIEIKDIYEKVFTGGPSRYRDVWIEITGDALRGFCHSMRAAADRVDDSIRLGFCTGYTSWDFEGADALELTKIFAGKNEPFLRFTGAPYWVSANRMARITPATVIESTRMQNAWCKGKVSDIFGEADTYPRDRFQTPAALSECFDLALRLENITDFKYVYAYSIQPTYDRGYVDAHLRNSALYADIDASFCGKQSVGVRVYEEMRKFKNFDFTEKTSNYKQVLQRTFFSYAQAMLSVNAIPTVYEGKGICGIAFGENAKYIDESAFENGLILDMKAAKILEDRGVDVGLVSYEPFSAAHEKFNGYDDTLLFSASATCNPTLKDGAKVISRFVDSECKTSAPAAYTYENAKGQRFLVYSFVGEAQENNSSLFWSYSRGKQINDTIPWLSGKEQPVRCDGNPFLYSLARENGERISVAYINAHPDEIYSATVKFGYNVTDLKFINCDGLQTDSRTAVIKYVKPYGFAAIDAKKI